MFMPRIATAVSIELKIPNKIHLYVNRNFSITAGKDRSQGLSKEAKSGLTER
jgi:hypothetical protein